MPAHFRFEPSDSGPTLFLKLVRDEARAAHLRRAERLVGWLAARGQPVVPCVNGFPRDAPGGGALFAYRFVEGRRIRPAEEDAVCLGRALAALHRSLEAHADLPLWRATTERRLAALEAVRDALATGRTEAGPAPDALRRLASERALSFAAARADAQPLHGDLNPGNILLSDGPLTPWLLDFEDALHSVLPPIVELAYGIERVILAQAPDDAQAVRLGRSFIAAYRANGGADTAGESLVETVRSLALRSLCVLAQSEAEGVPIAGAEWTKFFRLAERAAARARVLDAIAA